MTTVLAQSDTSGFSDVRARSSEQLVATAKTGRKDSFGELCERHTERSSVSPIGSARLIFAKLSLAFWVCAVPGYSHSAAFLITNIEMFLPRQSMPGGPLWERSKDSRVLITFPMIIFPWTAGSSGL